ncbi:MAG: hypothetical protein MJE12_03855, partial [Alphaproteobacteria bacterium]|nr:hypothetical protein [Alphaproteobacteria bacterium]
RPLLPAVARPGAAVLPLVSPPICEVAAAGTPGDRVISLNRQGVWAGILHRQPFPTGPDGDGPLNEMP